MEFPLRVDRDEAHTLVPLLAHGDAVAVVDNGRLAVVLGALFTADIPLVAVTGAALMPDPRPTVFLPLGVSLAPQQFGRDMLCAVGAYEGLLRIDFSEDVEGRTRPSGPVGDENDQAEPVRFRHLLLSVEDPEALAEALRSRDAGND